MKESILIVEDEPEFAALLERWIALSGYTPIIARTGNEALRSFYDQHPDLVVLDVSLPGLDGWQVIERIREFSRVPIIMATARGAETDKIRGLKLGADDYITKPLILSVSAPLAVAIMIGTRLNSRIRSMTCHPSSPGNETSSTTRSGCWS